MHVVRSSAFFGMVLLLATAGKANNIQVATGALINNNGTQVTVLFAVSWECNLRIALSWDET